jgi:predicted outer membrane repeat protein
VFRNNLYHSQYKEEERLSLFFRRAGGLTIFYYNDTSFGNALVQNCTFECNSAGLNESNKEDASGRPSLYVPRGHGGGLLLAFQNSVGYKVNVKNCTFSNNSARFTGGGISVQFYQGVSSTPTGQLGSHNNSVVIEDSVFLNNKCVEKGGGLSVNTFETANENVVVVNESRFEGNYAGTIGGAISSIIEVSVSIARLLYKESRLLTGQCSASGCQAKHCRHSSEE